MKRSKPPTKKLSSQIKNKVKMDKKEPYAPYSGTTDIMISTGSTLLDLAITGKVRRGGGLPGGILVEIFGPSGAGKTVLLSEIAGAIQRKGGEIMFHDPEARLNKQFARMFDLDIEAMSYDTPDTVPQVFTKARDWKPKHNGINGIMADSLAALSTDWELEGKDQYGMRRAKEFSEELRKTARIITHNNLLMVCSNQIREDQNAGPYGIKHKSPGGHAIGFYASVRLRLMNPKKIKQKITVAGKEVERVIGVETKVEVFKNSADAPYRTAPIIIFFDYGVDDVRANLQFIKDYTKSTVYTLGGGTLSKSMVESIAIVEEDNLEAELKEEVITLWESIEQRFDSNRKKKVR